MSAEPLNMSIETVPIPPLPMIMAAAPTADDAATAEKGLLIALLVMVLLGVAAMLFMN